MRTLCRLARLHYCDLLGQPIEAVAKVSCMAATKQPGGRNVLNETYFRRMEAIEFAVKYDDGMAGGLRDADIVIVGVSRTSKTFFFNDPATTEIYTLSLHDALPI